MSDKFIVKPRENSKKDERSMIMTLRIDRDLRGEFDRLSIQSDRSRNELMCMALQFALDHLEFQEQETENGCDSAESV